MMGEAIIPFYAAPQAARIARCLDLRARSGVRRRLVRALLRVRRGPGTGLRGRGREPRGRARARRRSRRERERRRTFEVGRLARRERRRRPPLPVNATFRRDARDIHRAHGDHRHVHRAPRADAALRRSRRAGPRLAGVRSSPALLVRHVVVRRRVREIRGTSAARPRQCGSGQHRHSHEPRAESVCLAHKVWPSARLEHLARRMIRGLYSWILGMQRMPQDPAGVLLRA
jgi:hypothetical protein